MSTPFVDLLLSVVPLRVVERHWITEFGRPDSLWISLSNGHDYSIKWIPNHGVHRVYVRDAVEVSDADTGLSGEKMAALAQEVFMRFAWKQVRQ